MSASTFRLARQATYPSITARDFDSPDTPSSFPAFEDDSQSLEAGPPTAHSHRMSWSSSWGGQRSHNPWDVTMDANPADSPALRGNNAAKALTYAPMYPSLTFALPTSYERMSAALEDDVASDYSGIHGTGSEWSDSDYDDEDEPMLDAYQPVTIAIDGPDLHRYDSPLVDDMSPIDNAEPGSSPGPMTPFGDYVDRAVVYPAQNATRHSDLPLYEGQGCGPDCTQCQSKQNVSQVEKPVPIATPSASEIYRKTADYLSVWVSEYVWKLCVTMPDRSGLSPAHPSIPPASLATAVRSLLLSTILQPSAIFLALKYISRLPVFLGPMYLPFGCNAEAKFRATLLGSPEAYDREDMESQAPFRLIVLGFMFANKWLDDHTFSNKTWHSISGVPIRWLNNLESCALTVFKHELNIPVQEWAEWLSHISSYHTSLLSGQPPQPIARPVSSPYNVVRKHIQDLTATSEIAALGGGYRNQPPRPVFTGLEERQRERVQQHVVQDIDLDEGGPLRDEYMPKRRSSISSAREHQNPSEVTRPRPLSFAFDRTAVDRYIPSTRWSPELDRPVDHSQPPSRLAAAPRAYYPGPPSTAVHLQIPPAVSQQWPATGSYAVEPHHGYPGPGYALRSSVGPGPTFAVPVFSPQHSTWPTGSYSSYAAVEPPRPGYAPVVRCGA